MKTLIAITAALALAGCVVDGDDADEDALESVEQASGTCEAEPIYDSAGYIGCLLFNGSFVWYWPDEITELGCTTICDDLIIQ